MTTDYSDEYWPCESAHRITVSLDGVDPVTVSLPHPIHPDTIKATLKRKDRVVDIVAAKSVGSLWPDDVRGDERRRWNVEELEPWTDAQSLSFHVYKDLHLHLNYLMKASGNENDALTDLRETIRSIFVHATQNGRVRFHLKLKGTADWYIRAHPPVRISPDGTPILLLTAVDLRQAERLISRGKLDDQWSAESFEDIFFGQRRLGNYDKVVICLDTTELTQLFCYILRLNSTKIQPSSWLKENISRIGTASPCLSTFVRPLYQDGLLNNGELDAITCGKCRKLVKNLRRCSRCKSVSYCSTECQRAHWPSHKAICVKAE